MKFDSLINKYIRKVNENVDPSTLASVVGAAANIKDSATKNPPKTPGQAVTDVNKGADTVLKANKTVFNTTLDALRKAGLRKQ